ncbi:MAG: hypothetical protein CFE46_04125 [Burkholderiales bacterium PBB6]|jgi:hypothetical protein|nr:MAG: hypothetical protein CFE46_04125 [Burkholderiales bacterium PBB6]
MGPLDVLWHLLNFFAPAVGVAVLAASLSKLVWRRGLRTVPWRTLVVWASAAGAVVLVAGLVLFGRDGRMLTYLALVGATALALWWKGLRHL